MFAFMPGLPFIRPVIVGRNGGNTRFTLPVQKQGFLKIGSLTQCIKSRRMKLLGFVVQKWSKLTMVQLLRWKLGWSLYVDH